MARNCILQKNATTLLCFSMIKLNYPPTLFLKSQHSFPAVSAVVVLKLKIPLHQIDVNQICEQETESERKNQREGREMCRACHQKEKESIPLKHSLTAARQSS
jgi:hypothetical protein